MSDRPPEFFTAEELAELLDTPQPARQVKILEAQRVPFVRSAAGRPLVYRDRLIPAPIEAHNPEATFDYAAARAPRTPTKREQSRSSPKT